MQTISIVEAARRLNVSHHTVGKWISSGLLVDRVRQVAGSEHLTLAGALAIRLIRYWDANHVFEPEAVFVPGEPGSDGGDE
jgi:hypothetical protein